jgi:hypothetical protein
VKSKVYLHKDAASAVNALQWALRAGRIPREIYLDNGKQFVSKAFKAEAQIHGIKLIFGRPYHLAAAGKLNDTTRLSTGNLSPSRSSGHSVISDVNSGTSITCTTTGASRRSWTG